MFYCEVRKLSIISGFKSAFLERMILSGAMRHILYIL